MKRNRRRVGMSENDWQQHKAWMRENTALRLLNHEYPFASRARDPEMAIPIDPFSCPQFCPECHGESMTVDGDGYAVECSRYRNRRDRAEMMAARESEALESEIE